MPSNRTSFLGLPLDSLTREQSLLACEQAIADRGRVHTDLNAANVLLALENRSMRAAIETSEIVNADGQSVVWCGRLLGAPVPERVSGIDLMSDLLSIAPERRYSVFLLGAAPEVNSRVGEILRARGVTVVGQRHGYWKEGDEASVVEEIANAAPDLLFLAMPSPKKETFVYYHLDALNVGLAFGVGGSFDVIAGVTKRAPSWMQRAGLEWMYRLAQEPRRLVKRYIVGNARFLGHVFRALIRQGRYKSDDQLDGKR